MIPAIVAAVRRAMRQHQAVPRRVTHLPLRTLLWGEVVWAVRQVLAAPWVLTGMVLGFVATFAVLGVGAPGPVAGLQWRVLLGLAVGLLLGVGARAVRTGMARTAPVDHGDGIGQAGPLTAATVVASGLALATLCVWLGVWVVAKIG